MRYVVIDDFGGNVNLSMNQEGEVLIFNTLYEAQIDAKEHQNATVFPLTNTIETFTRCEECISMLCSVDFGYEEAIEAVSDVIQELDDILGNATT